MANYKSTAVLEATGSFDKNPQRRRSEPMASDEMGPPPTYFDEDECAVWLELVETSPKGVLKNSDRSALEIATALLSDFRKDRKNFSTAKMTSLQKSLASLGRTPVDRGRLQAPEFTPPPNDPWAELSAEG